MPGIFAPVRFGGRLLIDGGVCNNVPVSALVNRGATYTVGVQLYKRIGALTAHGDGTLDEPDEEVEQRVGLGMWADRVRQRFGRETREADDRPNGLEVVQRALDIMMAQLEGIRLQTYRPDVLVVPRVGSLGLFSYSQEKEQIFQAGVEAAEQKIDELERLAQRVEQLRRSA
jgi:NTE family protein